jgi:hypothetical protein
MSVTRIRYSIRYWLGEATLAREMGFPRRPDECHAIPTSAG